MAKTILSKQRALNNFKGFVMLLLIALLPLILISISVLLISMKQIEIQLRLLQSCRILLLESQEQSATYIRTIIGLNTIQLPSDNIENRNYILNLIHKNINETSLRDELTDLVKSKGSLTELLTKIKKILIHRLFINKKNLDEKIKPTLGKEYNQHKLKNNKFFIGSEINIESNQTEILSIEAIQDSKNQVQYQIRKNFQNYQQQSLNWSFYFSIPKQNLYKMDWSKKVSGTCSTTLTKEFPWVPILTADKS